MALMAILMNVRMTILTVVTITRVCMLVLPTSACTFQVYISRLRCLHHGASHQLVKGAVAGLQIEECSFKLVKLTAMYIWLRGFYSTGMQPAHTLLENRSPPLS